MTPEEIEELRALAGRLSGTAYNENLAAILGAALEHIHMQEEQLANARAAKNLHARREAKLLSQVATLQEIAVEEGAYRAYYEANARTESYADYGYSLVADHLFSDARDRLAKEHPEVFR